MTTTPTEPAPQHKPRRKSGDSQRIQDAAVKIGINRQAIQAQFDAVVPSARNTILKALAAEHGVSDRSLVRILEVAGITDFREPETAKPASVNAILSETRALLEDIDRRLTKLETALGLTAGQTAETATSNQ